MQRLRYLMSGVVERLHVCWIAVRGVLGVAHELLD